MERLCCGTKLWRVDSATPVKIQTESYTPPGSYPLTITYRTDNGIERSTAYPLNVLPEPGSVRKDGPFPTSLALPILATWERDMLTYGQKHCTESEASLWEGFAWYYDGARVYSQIATYTHDGYWYSCADLEKGVYRPYVIDNGGAVPGYRVFPHGLAMDYERTGDALSRDAVELLYGNGWASVPNLAYAIGWGASREIAYALNTHLVHERLGGARNRSLQDLAEAVIGHFDQWFVSRKATYVQPFMVALSSEALIGYYELTGDKRVPPLLKLAADRLWEKSWDSSTHSFLYYNNDGTSSPAPDLNLLIAPLYGWVYQQTADAAYRTKGDEIFTGGVEGAWLDGGKQFSQNYRWSFEYLKWRSASGGEDTAPPVTNQAPTAALAANPTSGPAPLVVAFSGSRSVDPDGSIQSYAWDFGDGSTTAGSAVSHTYTQAGAYTAVLTVTDNRGATNAASTVITVLAPTNQAPKAVLASNLTSGLAPLVLAFSGSASLDPDGSIQSYSWDFGDGGTTTGSAVTHTYTQAGNYTAVLTVIDNRGATNTASSVITVYTPPNQTPKAVLTANVNSGQAPEVVTFSSFGSVDPDGSIQSYAWDFGDGNMTTGSEVAHTYTEAGDYTAVLTVTDNRGATNSAQAFISVLAAGTMPRAVTRIRRLVETVGSGPRARQIPTSASSVGYMSVTRSRQVNSGVSNASVR
jgi:PKD repeat protein